MVALLRTRRWMGFTMLVLLAIVGFGLLSHWQFTRAEDKRAERLALSTASAAAPLDLATATSSDLAALPEWGAVTATGSYGPEQVVVRQRPQHGTNGYWVLAPLHLDAPDGAGAWTLWVSRGWIPAGQAATTTPDIPPTPVGAVTVRGGWHDFEAFDADRSEGLPAGMVANVAPQALPVESSFAGYVQVSESVPADDAVTSVPAPTIDEGRNLSYAGQWLIFAFVAIVGWYVFLRREAKDIAREQAEAEGMLDGSPAR